MVFYGMICVYCAWLEKVWGAWLSTGFVTMVFYAVVSVYRAWLDKM